MSPIFFILTSYRRWVVLFLYSPKFLPVISILPFQFLGDIFKIMGWTVALPLSARAYLKAMLGFEVGTSVVFYLMAHFLIPTYGLRGAAFSYLLMYLLHFTVVSPYMHRLIGFRFEKANYPLIIGAILLLISGAFLDITPGYQIPLTLIIITCWISFVLKKHEKKYLKEKIASVMLRLRGDSCLLK